jgi:hypothetical protein
MIETEWIQKSRVNSRRIFILIVIIFSVVTSFLITYLGGTYPFIVHLSLSISLGVHLGLSSIRIRDYIACKLFNFYSRKTYK